MHICFRKKSPKNVHNSKCTFYFFQKMHIFFRKNAHLKKTFYVQPINAHFHIVLKNAKIEQSTRTYLIPFSGYVVALKSQRYV